MKLSVQFVIQRGAFRLEVDLDLPGRGVVGVYGPSGCGKTTLLRAIAGLDRWPEGRLRVLDEVWQDGATFVPPHRRAVGYVFQEASLFPHLSVRRNLEYGLTRVPKHARRIELDGAVALLGLDALLDRSPEGLSGGERQRVAIARALVTSPRLLLMDEPLSSLDTVSKNEILPFLERVHRDLEIPILYVSHAIDEVARLADHLVVMARGRVEAAGPISEIMTSLDLPIAHGEDAEAVIDARVVSHDARYQLTRIEFPGGSLTTPRVDLPPGQSVRVRIHARDVSLSLERHSGTSILNIFPATVTSIGPESGSQVMVRLEAGGAPILSRVTRKSAEHLELEPGRELYVQVKSVALTTSCNRSNPGWTLHTD